MEQKVESGYHALRETVERYINKSGYSVVNLTELFSGIFKTKKNESNEIKSAHTTTFVALEVQDEEEDEDM